jgi:hypothetical protein
MFCEQLRAAVYAEGPSKTFVHRNQARYAVFKKAISRTGLDFRPFEQPESYSSPFNVDADLDGDDTGDQSREGSEDEVGVELIVPEVLGLYDVRKVIKQ